MQTQVKNEKDIKHYTFILKSCQIFFALQSIIQFLFWDMSD